MHRNRGWAEVSHGCRANPSVTRSEPDLLQILQKMSEKPGWTRTAGRTDQLASSKPVLLGPLRRVVTMPTPLPGPLHCHVDST